MIAVGGPGPVILLLLWVVLWVTLAAGAIAFAVRTLICMLRREGGSDGPRPRAATVIGWAFLLSCVGFIVAAYAAAESLRGANGPTGVRGTPSDVTVVWAAGFFAGGIGWFIGAVIGWRRSRTLIERGDESRGVCQLGWWAALGLGIVVAVPAASGAPVAVMFAASAALVIVTLMVLGQRRTSHRSGAMIGATAGIVILVLAGMQFSSLLPLDRAWLIAWRSDQLDAESFAPNLLAAAPHECATAPGDDDENHESLADDHDSLGRREWARPPWLQGHVPRWLPSGFGLLAWSLPPGGTAGLWTDDHCRQIKLVLFEGNPESGYWNRFPVAARVGAWDVLARPRSGCNTQEAPCLEYFAWSPEVRGDRRGEILGLHLLMHGIGRETGDKIALGIPV